jgi:hypothetical protein
MVRLSLHRPQARILEKKPIVHLVFLARATRVGDLVVRVILINEVLEDRTGFEEVDGLAIGEGVGQSGNAAIRVNSEEPRLFLLGLREGDGVDLVREPDKVEPKM